MMLKKEVGYEEFLRELKFHDHVISAPQERLNNNLPKQSWYDTVSGVVIMSPIYKDAVAHIILKGDNEIIDCIDDWYYLNSSKFDHSGKINVETVCVKFV